MTFIFLPLTGALIGWITNLLAIRLLFHPRQPLQLWPLPFKIQGLLPKRRGELAENIADIVSEQLFSLDELTAQVDLSQLQNEVKSTVEKIVVVWCTEKLAVLPTKLRNYITNFLRDHVAGKVAEQFPEMAQAFLLSIRKQIDVRKIVVEKINGLSLAEIEGLVWYAARHELRMIEWVGGLLGFVVGLVQAFFVWYLA
ncbi:MAG: DUF445 family protein [Firmicutes bacterium]|nr:DUF445 family protein [Bacillota bacterium]